ncbi:hypothetical protein LJD42_28295, partial [Escherichia coli]|nr:hypothetical protein [Escherichia coli]
TRASGLDDAAFFARDLRPLTPLDKKAGAAFLAELADSAAGKECPVTAGVKGNAKAAAFLAAVLDLSPYLRTVFIRRPAILEPLFAMPLAQRLDALMQSVAASSEAENITETGIMAVLRQLKLEGHVLIALGDLSGVFVTAETT